MERMAMLEPVSRVVEICSKGIDGDCQCPKQEKRKCVHARLDAQYEHMRNDIDTGLSTLLCARDNHKRTKRLPII